MTVLAQALALSLRSTFFFRFLMGVFLPLPGMDVSENPGNSPFFQCFFLAGEEDEDEEVDFLVFRFTGAANAQRTNLDSRFCGLLLVPEVAFRLRLS